MKSHSREFLANIKPEEVKAWELYANPINLKVLRRARWYGKG